MSHKKLVIPGERFNRWTAIRLIERRASNYFWLFRCDCGNERIRQPGAIRRGNSKSCGCIRTELQQNISVGESFNRLTAVKRADKEGYWHFKCVCGNEKAIKVYGVRSGEVKSCGCLRDQRRLPSIRIGDSFGNLTAVRALNGGSNVWLFKCACGNECSPRVDRIINGRIKSCGCLRSLGEDSPARRTGIESGTVRISRMFATRKSDARKRGIPFILLKSDITALAEKQNWKCAQTGIALDLLVGAGVRPFGPSIDRIDNARGYEPGNIQLVCFMYNCAKGAFEDDDVFEFADALLKHSLTINKPNLRIVV